MLREVIDKESVSNFDLNPRRKQEIRMRPVADDIYRRVFGDSITITRYERDQRTILDLHFAIDVELEFGNGLILIGQEKFLSAKYAHYHSITVEYMQNSEELGDWFKLAAQFYMTGYASVDWQGFLPWMIVYWPAVVVCTNRGLLRWDDNENKDGRAQASFKYCDMETLLNHPECIIASSYNQLC